MAKGGGIVQVIERANGVLDPDAIGYIPRNDGAQKARRSREGMLSRRTREEYCPVESKDLVQYAQDIEPITDHLLWVNPCPD